MDYLTKQVINKAARIMARRIVETMPPAKAEKLEELTQKAAEHRRNANELDDEALRLIIG